MVPKKIMKRKMFRDRGMEMGEGLFRTAIVRVSITPDEIARFVQQGFETHLKYLRSRLPNGPYAAVVAVNLKNGQAYVDGIGDLRGANYVRDLKGLRSTKIFIEVGSINKEESAHFIRQIARDLEKLLDDSLRAFGHTLQGMIKTRPGIIKPRIW